MRKSLSGLIKKVSYNKHWHNCNIYILIKSSEQFLNIEIANSLVSVSGNLASNNEIASSTSNLAHFLIYEWAMETWSGFNQSIALKNNSKADGIVDM